VGYKFTLVLSREISDDESAILREAGCESATFGPDSLPTNADVPVTKMDFDDATSPSLAEAIESALEAVKKVPDLSVPGLTVPAQPAHAEDAEKDTEKTATAEILDATTSETPDAAAEETAGAKKASAKKPAAKKPAARKTSARKKAEQGNGKTAPADGEDVAAPVEATA
jgi:hypothetical protein